MRKTVTYKPKEKNVQKLDAFLNRINKKEAISVLQKTKKDK